MCELPCKEKFWMCPSHVEHILDRGIFPKTNRLTDRIKLFNLYTSVTNNTEYSKFEFFKKINQIKQEEPYEYQITNQSQLKRCKIPSSIKKVYKKQINININGNSCDEQSAIEQSAIEALQLLSQNSSNSSNLESDSINDDSFFFSIKKFNFNSDVKPSALFLVMDPSMVQLNDFDYEKLDMNELIENKDLLFVPFDSNKQAISIGSSPKMDVVLDKNFFNAKTQLAGCCCISKYHACVFYDKKSNTYELLNYSEHGTLVDNFCYGLDFEGNIRMLINLFV